LKEYRLGACGCAASCASAGNATQARMAAMVSVSFRMGFLPSGIG
jgi:hypothetical protein